MAIDETFIQFDDEATEEQRAALNHFIQIAQLYSEPELLAALTIADIVPQTAAGVVLPFSKDPERSKTLFEAWRGVKETNAYAVAGFDMTTERVIENDLRVKELGSGRGL